MRRISTLLLASACLFSAAKVSAQNPTTNCLVVNSGVCDQVIENFSTSPNAMFDMLGFQWVPAAQLLRVSNVSPSTSYNVVTPAPGYVLFNNGFVRTGFTLTTGTGSNNYFQNGNTVHLTLQIFSSNMLNLLAQCDYDLSAAGAYCFSVADVDLVSGVPVRYRYTFTTNQNTSTTGGGPVLEFDNITVVSNTQAPLPVRFNSFTGRTNGNNVEVSWGVGEEINVLRYDIERSSDGVRFGTIGSVAANGSATYNYTDGAPISNGYYRIKSVDVDGKIGYSTILLVRNGNSETIVRAFLSNANTLTVQHSAAGRDDRISVLSSDGRLVRTITPTAGSQQSTVNVSDLRAGMYIMQFESGKGEASSVKFIKQ